MNAAPLRGVFAAFRFFTRVPIGPRTLGEADWRWAAAHAPLVGLAVGGAVGFTAQALAPVGELGAAALAVSAGMLVTGAFHEDGLADTCDALGGSAERERVFEILKDSRVGTFGSAALAASFVARVALLARAADDVLWVAALGGCAARVGPTWLLALLPYVSRTPKSAAVCRGGVTQAFVASLWLAAAVAAVLAASILSPVRALTLFAALTLTAAILGWRFRVRAGGVTGDFLGATEQAGEIIALAVLVWEA